MAIRIALVMITVTLISYWHVISILESQTLEQLEKYIVERGQRESNLFHLAEDNHATFQQKFLSRYREMAGIDPLDKFSGVFEEKEDQTLRIRAEEFEGIAGAGGDISLGMTGFISEEVTLTSELRRRTMIIYDLLKIYGPAWENRFPNLYITMPENIFLIYWPGVPAAANVTAGTDLTQEEWVYIADTTHNPSREPAWTGLYYDELVDDWMVSCETPFDVDGQHLITIGHDILLTDLFERTINDHLDGTYNLIFREDGRLIVHPEHMDEVQAQQGEFNILESDDEELIRIFQQVTSQLPDHAVLESDQNDAYLAVTKLEGPEWYFVTVYPYSLLTEQAFDIARFIFLLGLISLLAEIGILFFVLREQVAKPLNDFIFATQRVAQGYFNLSVNDNDENHLPVERHDEIGQLANSFRHMAEQLQSYFTTLDAKNAELQRLDKLKDDFLANTSHELRTPLNGIIGLTESMIDGATGELSPLQKQNLSMVVRSGMRLATLLNDILDFSKLKHQALTLQSKPLALQPLVELVLTLSRPLVGSKPLQLINQIDLDLPLVYADENRLQQILYNLVGNAIKFTEMGQIIVSASLEADIEPGNATAVATNDYILVSVSDTGIGIPPDKQEQIFEAFEQGDGSTARQYGGTGLGLAVTRQLVELHGGQIMVDSTVGQGSCFSFTLPISSEEAQEKQSTIDSKSAQKQERLIRSLWSHNDTDIDSLPSAPTAGEFHILVVDDEQVNRQVLLNQLSLQNYRVSTAVDGPNALELLQKQAFDLVVLDVMMPRMSGYEVCQRIRAHYSATELPVIMLTAKNQVVDLIVGFESGANDYLTKPFDKAELLQRVKSLLMLKRSEDELKEYRTKLEERVKERTEELTDVLNHLQATQSLLVRAKEKAESANRAKSNFLSNMSHELRTPLNGILGYAQILKRSTLDSSQKKGIETIYQSGHHLLTLINDILDLSKIEAGKMELLPTTVHLPSFLEQIVAMMRMRAHEKDLSFVYEPHEALPNGVQADEKRLRQVLINLLGNAIKFTNIGQVTVNVHPLAHHARRCTLRFSVTDTGVGMREEQLAKIFLPFEQVGSQKQRAKGTGLGLAITRQLVSLMGGEVHVVSEPGQGSTFWFDLTLPIVEVEAEAQPEESRYIVGYKGTRRTLLVVDDQPENRLVLRHMLSPLGFTIKEAENGQQAVQEARHEQPDLILTDLVMPVMNGFEAVKEIRQFAPHLPIIAISANAFEAKQQRSLKVGCNAFLPKPVDKQELLALIEAHLKLTWIHEEQPEATPQAQESQLVPPPQQALETLYEAATLGMMSQIRQQMDKIEQLDANYTPFAQKVRQLARGFEDEQIVALVEKYLDANS